MVVDELLLHFLEGRRDGDASLSTVFPIVGHSILIHATVDHSFDGSPNESLLHEMIQGGGFVIFVGLVKIDNSSRAVFVKFGRHGDL